MLLLSGVILSLLLLVLLTGINGLSNTVVSGQKISAGEELNNSLSQLEIDHLNWANRISTLFNDDTVNELHVQTDPHKCRFGKWFYGEGRQQAEKMVPSIKSDIQALEVAHTKLHASAKKIKDTYRAADIGLPQFFAKKERDHMGWAFKVQNAILSHKKGVKVIYGASQCSLGKFLYDDKGDQARETNPELAKIFMQIEAPHIALHKHGKIIDGMLKAGDNAGAATYFSKTATPTLKEMKRILTEAGEIATKALDGQQKAKHVFITETQPNLTIVQKQLRAIKAKVKLQIDALNSSSAETINAQKTTVSTIGIIALILGLGISILISRSLTAPMTKTVNMLEELEKGHLSSRLQLNRNDEIGKMADSMDRFADSLQNEVVGSLRKLADGDLSVDITPQGEHDELRIAIKLLGNDLNTIMGQIMVAAEEISSASGEIADSSQSLSQGTTESAASLEEISASLNQTSSQTALNAENATQANGLSTDTKQAAEKGSRQMHEMVVAMEEINESGQKISKIIKTIDEIAFQTNLLALNAAVEAARAGQHGKGFAVVAEEVRNLAARSAKAAAETSELIEGSVTKTTKGSTIANQTANALGEIVTGITKVTDLVAEISAASNEQALGVAEINQGITQIDTVTQQNTANAEQSAAAAEELSAQAAQLRHMLQRFKLKNNGGKAALNSLSGERSISAAMVATTSDNGWGSMEIDPNTQIALS